MVRNRYGDCCRWMYAHMSLNSEMIRICNSKCNFSSAVFGEFLIAEGCLSHSTPTPPLLLFKERIFHCPQETWLWIHDLFCAKSEEPNNFASPSANEFFNRTRCSKWMMSRHISFWCIGVRRNSRTCKNGVCIISFQLLEFNYVRQMRNAALELPNCPIWINTVLYMQYKVCWKEKGR